MSLINHFLTIIALLDVFYYLTQFSAYLLATHATFAKSYLILKKSPEIMLTPAFPCVPT